MPERPLETYRKKRDFTRTTEPEGAPSGRSGNLYMIHKHDATRLHYDLRLQVGDVLKSWAVPKGPSLDPKEKRLAVEVEDHPLEYGGFEGTIPEGQYGAGATLIWDSGTWAPMGDLQSSLEKGALKFRLAGEKLHGGWMLTRLKHRPGEKKNNWLLIKEHDDAASDIDILEARPESVKSGRNVEELKQGVDPTWQSKPAKRPRTPRNVDPDKPKAPAVLKPGALKGAKAKPLPKSFKPQLATQVDEPPSGKEWLHEIKFDGYRTIAIVDEGKARLLTRNGHDWTNKYAALAEAFAALTVKSAVIDGEVVVPDELGVTHFGDLQDAIANGESSRMVFYAFDLPYLNGYDLTGVALVERKKLLEKLLAPVVGDHSAIQYSAHVAGQGNVLFDKASEAGLEGVVSKRADAHYFQDRSKTWLKAKSKKLEAFTIVGYTTSPQAGGLAALLLAEEGEDGLVSVGKVGTGFSSAEVKSLPKRLDEYARTDAPVEVPALLRKGAHWIEPVLKARVLYSNKTRDNQVRHGVFRGLREPEFSAPKNAARMKRYITDAHLASIWVTNPERRMFSKTGPTKLDLAVYYARVGDAMLPHILQRPVSLVRCPSGKLEDCFFQRHAFAGMPAEVKTFVSKREKDEEERNYLVIADAAGFLALAQFGVIEFHPWGCRVDKPERPDRMFFDLDPGEGVEWRDVKAAAEAMRAELSRAGLKSFAKTSGKKGIHVVVPIERRASWKELHELSGAIAVAVARRHPDTFVTTMAKSARKRRIFLDFHRNARSATAVGVYSLRAARGLPASTPVAWEDLRSIDAPEDLNYATVPGFLSNSGDPWAEMDAHAAVLGKDLASRISA
jgi:bifunctional non-homologous end joining protein LigD